MQGYSSTRYRSAQPRLGLDLPPLKRLVAVVVRTHSKPGVFDDALLYTTSDYHERM